ncbi:MAG TPA: DUF192 domain-containing protein [Planctomycetota bacterium]|nr:DUF192 domain-containing protein [Planctomycetota bacterium]
MSPNRRLRVVAPPLAALLFACAGDPPAANPPPRTDGSVAPTSRQAPDDPPAPAPPRVGLGSRTAAVTPLLYGRLRGVGFAGRSHIADDEALLFVYRTPDERAFWMKGCLVPIDVAYLADDGTILERRTLLPPPPGAADDDVPRFPSSRPVRLVLETRGGLLEESGAAAAGRVVLPPEVAGWLERADR